MASCGCEFENGTANIDELPALNFDEHTPRLVHPGILHNKESIESMRAVVAAADATSPAYQTYLLLKEDYRAKSDFKMRGPYEIIARGTDSEYLWTKGNFEADFGAAYLNSLMWVVTGEKVYANKAKEILVAYGNKLKRMDGADQALLGGFNGFQLAYALELIRYNLDGSISDILTDTEFNQVSSMLRNVFLPVLEEFYATPPYSNGNWGLTVTRTYLAFALLWDDIDMYHKGIKFYLTGNDNGTLNNYIDAETGQTQETGREQAHAQLGIGQIGSICELAWKQGDDLYSLNGNAVMKAFEYSARYNMGYDDLPFKMMTDVSGKNGMFMGDKIGSKYRGELRSIYAMGYNHYAKRKGLNMPHTKELLDAHPLGSYNGDGIDYDPFQFCDGLLGE